MTLALDSFIRDINVLMLSESASKDMATPFMVIVPEPVIGDPLLMPLVAIELFKSTRPGRLE